MKALSTGFKQYAILAIAFSFWLFFFTERPYMGSKFHMDTFTTGDRHCTDVNLSFCQKMWLFHVPIRRLWVNQLNNLFDSFSRLCNIFFQIHVSSVGSVIICVVGNIQIGKNWNKSHRNMLNSNGPSMKPCEAAKIISDDELYVPFNFTLCFCLVKSEGNYFKEGISTA